MGNIKSVLVDDLEHCMLCGSPYPQIHHVLFGTANRKISDRMGYVVPLCQYHHTGNRGVHQVREFDLALKRVAQSHFEAHTGTREEFIILFGRSYL